MKIKKIFFATTNKSKWKDFKIWCSNVDYKHLTPFDISKSLWPKFEENGITYEENARIKALNWSNVVSDVFVLANDCGLDIPALGRNWEGILTKRLVGGDESSDFKKIQKFIDIMKDLKGEDRTMQWYDVIVIAKNGKILGTSAAKGPKGYAIEKLNENLIIIPGAALATVDFRPQYGKVYSEFTDKEMKESDQYMIKPFQKLIEKIVV